MQSKLEITVHGEDTTFKKIFNVYDQFMISHECPIFKGLVEQTISEFKGNPEDISFKISGYW